MVPEDAVEATFAAETANDTAYDPDVRFTPVIVQVPFKVESTPATMTVSPTLYAGSPDRDSVATLLVRALFVTVSGM